ncbi:hypothetical protein [Rhizobium leguminosarum]|uniref:hypothetical protein n=1 Tax=Rhizobium leguminosarum TaxID=384 RepID=UPI000B928721|nr:hypothetical protein [Rhizobium leguminosarum]ASS56847.1 hypothetical protein CHR56_21075 [Rhizobium leguminosarum bv. viciae]NEI89550.1 hypothetical protein [Rhizobium leguminosarum]
MSRPLANKAETKADPFADEIAMRLAMRRLVTIQPKDPKTMTMAEILAAIDRLAAQAGRLAHG